MIATWQTKEPSGEIPLLPDHPDFNDPALEWPQERTLQGYMPQAPAKKPSTPRGQPPCPSAASAERSPAMPGPGQPAAGCTSIDRDLGVAVVAWPSAMEADR